MFVSKFSSLWQLSPRKWGLGNRHPLHTLWPPSVSSAPAPLVMGREEEAGKGHDQESLQSSSSLAIAVAYGTPGCPAKEAPWAPASLWNLATYSTGHPGTPSWHPAIFLCYPHLFVPLFASSATIRGINLISPWPTQVWRHMQTATFLLLWIENLSKPSPSDSLYHHPQYADPGIFPVVCLFVSS